MTSEIKLHPLVLLNISDHHTRSKLIHDQVVQSVGALMGVQQGRIIQLNNSFEIPLTKDGIDKEFIVKKLELYKQVFPELDFMGWYTTAETDLNSFNQKVILSN
jgi:COP9 signalosome complex subunit 6